jgi:hypothetical protein
MDSRVEVSTEASAPASSEESNATPLAWPDTALIPGSGVDAGVPARPLAEHALQSEVTVAAPFQDMPSPVLPDDAAVAGFQADQSKELDRASAVGPNQSDPMASPPSPRRAGYSGRSGRYSMSSWPLPVGASGSAIAAASLVTGVATRALKAVWRQKWLVHRRLRPEAYGGLVERNMAGAAYPVPADITNTQALVEVESKFGGYLLPMAFPEGSPMRPAYGAGHAPWPAPARRCSKPGSMSPSRSAS